MSRIHQPDSYSTKTLGGSLVPTMGDCERRAATKRFYADLVEAGFLPNKGERAEHQESIAQRIGKAVHAAVERGLVAKKNRADGGDIAEPLDAFRVLHFGDDPEEEKLLEETVTFDSKCSNAREAVVMLEKLMAPIKKVIDKIEPDIIEGEFTASPDWMNGWTLSCHPDVYSKHGAIHDIKTMKSISYPPAYQAQLGTYAVVLKENGIGVNALIVDAIQKPGKTTTPPDPIQIPYPVQASVDHAVSMIQDFTQKADAFFDPNSPVHHNPRVFRENPQSTLCSKRFCPAFGTDFCPVTKEN